MEKVNSIGLNVGKRYQIILFPFNNAAANCYLTLFTFITYYGSLYLSGSFVKAIVDAALMTGLTVAVSTLATVMRVFDGVTDPVCGALMDKTNGRFGKFRPFIIIGNIMMAVSVLAMFFFIRPVENEVARWILFILLYAVYVLGYTAQCACTKAGQTCITNEPHQRSQFVIWNMVGMIGSIVLINLIGNGLLPMFIDPFDQAANLGAQYNPAFYDILVPVTVGLSAFYTVLALIGIWKKDRKEYWGIDSSVSQTKVRFRDYVGLLKHNSQIRWLVLSAGCNKLASTIATSGTVAILMYSIMMGSYNGLYIPIYALSFVFMGVFFILGTRTAGAKGQKRAVAQYTSLAFLFYIVLVVMLLVWNPEDPNTHLSLIHWGEDGSIYFSTNLFTILWIVFYGCGYGAYNCCSEMSIPMIADCIDYETYRSGNYVPGIMGTIFSLIEKLVSSLATLLTTVFTVGLIPALGGNLPSTGTEITDFTGVRLSAIICFCALPMISWLITIISMFFYKLSGERLKEIQAVNAVRKAAMAGGMSKEEAMKTWVTIDQVPAQFIPEEKPRIDKKTGRVLPPRRESIADKIYNKIWGRREKVLTEPSSNAIPIPQEFLTEEVAKFMQGGKAAADIAEDRE